MNSYKPNRMSESGSVPFRSDRIFCIKDEWFFAVRRGPDHGPFASQEEAQQALVAFIKEQLALEKKRKAERDLYGSLHPNSGRLVLDT
jgi:hypothetical protein